MTQSARPFRAIVTGAASGIGRATAQRLCDDARARGVDEPQVALADIAEAPLHETARIVKESGARAHVIVGDLSDASFPQRLIDIAAAAMGGIDVLVSNAGIFQKATLLELSVADYDRTFAINTRATWLLAKAAFPHLQQSRGVIVATSSIAAYEPTPAIGAYSASKAALMMIIRQLACDWGPYGIRCNSVSPGTTRTNISANSGVESATPSRGVNPLGIVAEPEDQAAAIAFLASPDARFVNGADLVVDGGARTQLMVASGMAQSRSTPE